MPGKFATFAPPPVSRLKSEDFPQLGLPTRTIVGMLTTSRLGELHTRRELAIERHVRTGRRAHMERTPERGTPDHTHAHAFGEAHGAKIRRRVRRQGEAR